MLLILKKVTKDTLLECVIATCFVRKYAGYENIDEKAVSRGSLCFYVIGDS